MNSVHLAGVIVALSIAFCVATPTASAQCSKLKVQACCANILESHPEYRGLCSDGDLSWVCEPYFIQNDGFRKPYSGTPGWNYMLAVTGPKCYMLPNHCTPTGCQYGDQVNYGCTDNDPTGAPPC